MPRAFPRANEKFQRAEKAILADESCLLKLLVYKQILRQDEGGKRLSKLRHILRPRISDLVHG
jgi:hypothetical protein